MSHNLRLIIAIGTPYWIAVVAFLCWIALGERPLPSVGLPLLTGLLWAAAAYPLLTIAEIRRERKSRQSRAPVCAPASDALVSQQSVAGERPLMKGVHEMPSRNPERGPKPNA